VIVPFHHEPDTIVIQDQIVSVPEPRPLVIGSLIMAIVLQLVVVVFQLQVGIVTDHV